MKAGTTTAMKPMARTLLVLLLLGVCRSQIKPLTKLREIEMMVTLIRPMAQPLLVLFLLGVSRQSLREITED
jgi:hypothetical protein